MAVSFIVKTKISYFLAGAYGLSVLLSLFGSERLFFGSKYPIGCIAYLFGVAAWYFSA